MTKDILNKTRGELLASVVDFFVRDTAVVGVFLGGSIPAGTADEYSDIDLRVVVVPSEHNRFIENRMDMPKQWGEWLFNEWIEGATHCVSHFRPFCKIDVFYLSLTEFIPSPWYSLPVEILYDPNGTLAEVVIQSRNLLFNVTDDEIDRSISKGLASCHEAYRRICRSECFFAQSLLDSIRYYMIQADDWLNHRTPITVVFSKFEQRGTESIIKTFRDSYVGLERHEILKVLKTLIGTYREQIIELHKLFALSRPLKNDLYAVDLVLNGGWGR